MKMIAKNIIRHSLVIYKDEICMIENKPKKPMLITQDQKGWEISPDTELEVFKFPAQLAMERIKIENEIRQMNKTDNTEMPEQWFDSNLQKLYKDYETEKLG